MRRACVLRCSSRHAPRWWAPIVLTWAFTATAPAVCDADLISAANARREPLLKHMNDVRAAVSGTFLERGATLLRQPVEQQLSEASKVALLRDIDSVGREPEAGRPRTQILRDPDAVAVLASSLADPSKSVRRDALEYLRQGQPPPGLLAPHAAEILAAFDDYPQGDPSIEIVALLPLPEAKRAKLLGTEQDPKVRARLGDATARSEVIARFKQAATFDDKVVGAEQLGYIGGPEAGRALVEELHSPLQRRGCAELFSATFFMLRALGRIHPDVPLLTTDLARTRDTSDRAAVASYLDRVDAWAVATYRVAPTGPRPTPLLRESFPCR